jgi:hypothetical protein
LLLQSIALVTGRLLVMLGGTEKLSFASLPLLMEAVAMASPPDTTQAVQPGDEAGQELELFACFARTIAGEIEWYSVGLS